MAQLLTSCSSNLGPDTYARSNRNQNGQRIHIVGMDWLEFTMMKGRKLKEADYSFKALDAEQRREQVKPRKELYEMRQRELEERLNYVNQSKWDFATCHDSCLC